MHKCTTGGCIYTNIAKNSGNEMVSDTVIKESNVMWHLIAIRNKGSIKHKTLYFFTNIVSMLLRIRANLYLNLEYLQKAANHISL